MVGRQPSNAYWPRLQVGSCGRILTILAGHVDGLMARDKLFKNIPRHRLGAEGISLDFMSGFGVANEA